MFTSDRSVSSSKLQVQSPARSAEIFEAFKNTGIIIGKFNRLIQGGFSNDMQVKMRARAGFVCLEIVSGLRRVL